MMEIQTSKQISIDWKERIKNIIFQEIMKRFIKV